MLYNLLNFPAGAVPVSTVTAEDEEELRHYTGNYQDKFDRLFKEVGNAPVTKNKITNLLHIVELYAGFLEDRFSFGVTWSEIRLILTL